MKDKLISKGLVFLLIFVSVSVLLSFITGYIWRNTYFILGLSVPISHYLYRKHPYEFEVPKSIYMLTLLTLVLTCGPLLILTPYYPGAADALGTTIVRVIGDKIPVTYAPYSNLKLAYHLGFHLFAKLFIDLLPFIPDYLILWFFAVLFASLQVILLYQFGKTFFGSSSYGEWLALLLVGTKTVYQYTFWGMAPMLLGLDLFLLFFTLFIERNRLCYLFFPMIFAAHPFVFFMTVFVVGVYSLVNRGYLKNFLTALPTFLLILPFVAKTYFAYTSNILAPESYPYAAPFSPVAVLRMTVALVLWLGPVPALFALGGLCLTFKRKLSGKRLKFAGIILGTSSLGYVILYFPGYIWNDKLFYIVNFSALLLAGTFLEASVSDKNKYVKHIKLLILVFCVLTYFSSGELTHLRSGSKVSKDEVAVSRMLYRLDPALELTLFLSPGGGWMAHISNKIPYDASVSHLVPPYGPQAIKDEGWEELEAKRELQRHIYETGCVECVYELGVKYVVINRDYRDMTLPEAPVMTYKGFDVYKLRG